MQRMRRRFSTLPRWQKIALLAIGVPVVLAGFLIVVGCILFVISSFQWNGEELRQQETIFYTELDYRQPEGGLLYRVVGEDGQQHYYARLPEIRYRILPERITFDI